MISGGGGKDRVRGARTKESVVEVKKEKVSVVRKKVHTEKIEKAETENLKAVGAKSNEKLDREMKKEDIVGTKLMGSGAAESEAGPE